MPGKTERDDINLLEARTQRCEIQWRSENSCLPRDIGTSGRDWRAWLAIMAAGNARESRTGAKDGEMRTCDADVEAEGEVKVEAEGP